jgi:hypothetical protein
MADFDWKAIVKSVAPMLGTALGGPLAGLAISAIGQALGIDDKTAESVKAAVLDATPEQLLAIRLQESQFAEHMAELGYKNVESLAKIAADDRASARSMAVATGDIWTPRLLAVLIVIAWCLVQWFLLQHVIDTSMRELIARVLGTLDAALTMVLAFYFGSSAGSESKTRMLAAQIPARDAGQ